MTLKQNFIIKLAVAICNNANFKKKIFIIHETLDFIWETENFNTSIERYVLSLDLLKLKIRQKLVGVVICIAMRMLTWMKYHIKAFAFTREFCIEFLTESLFMSNGLMDDEKVAKLLVDNEKLSNLQKFYVASYYCIIERIPLLFKNMSKSEKEIIGKLNFFPEKKDQYLIYFWAYFMTGKIDELKGTFSVDKCRYEYAIASGSMMGIQYCLQKSTLLKRNDILLIDAAKKIIKHTLLRFGELDNNVPNQFLIDSLYFLLIKMTSEQTITFVRDVLILLKTDLTDIKSSKFQIVLQYLISWPYQDKFLEFLRSSIEVWPVNLYLNFLSVAINKFIISSSYSDYGDNKCYNYRKFFKRLWKCSPYSFKRYIFSSQTNQTNSTNQTDETKTQSNINIEGTKLLLKILNLNNLTSRDERIIKIILKSATKKEKNNILKSDDGSFFRSIMQKREKPELLDNFLSMCCSSAADIVKYKKKYLYELKKNRCLEFIRINCWAEADDELKFIKLSEDAVKAVKRKIVFSAQGRDTCRKLFLKKIESAFQLTVWSFDSRFASLYRQVLLLETKGYEFCIDLIEEGSLHLADEFVTWCLSHKGTEKITQFKRKFINKLGFDIIKNMLLSIWNPETENGENRERKLKEVQRFLLWGYTTKLEVAEFKYIFFKNSAEELLVQLFKLCMFDRIIELFSWLKSELLSEVEIRIFLKEKLYGRGVLSNYFNELVTKYYAVEISLLDGSKKRIIEYFLKFILVDEISIKEFMEYYKKRQYFRYSFLQAHQKM